MALQVARCAVISGDNQNVRVEFLNPTEHRIELLDPSHFFREIPILSGAVGVLKVQEKEVVSVPVRSQLVDLLFQTLRVAHDVHPDKSGQSFVHRVHSDRRGPQSIDLLVGRKLRFGRKPPHGVKIRLRMTRQNRLCLAQEFLGHLGGFLALRILCDGL